MVLIFTCLYRIISGRPLSVYRILLLKANNAVTFYSWGTSMSAPLPHSKPPVRWHWRPPQSGIFCNNLIWRNICDFPPWTAAAASGIINSCAIIISHLGKVESKSGFLPFLSSVAAFGALSVSLQSLRFGFAAQLNFGEPANKIPIQLSCKKAT